MTVWRAIWMSAVLGFVVAALTDPAFTRDFAIGCVKFGSLIAGLALTIAGSLLGVA